MTKPPIYLVERQTVDWLALDDRTFYAQSVVFCRLWGKPDDFIWQLKQLWDATFGVSYCQTRAQLKDLAHANWQRATDLECIYFDHYQNVPRVLQSESADAWYLFVDDDDWVSPDIALQLQQLSAQIASDAVLWRATNIGSPQQQDTVFTWGLNGRVMTNNYAVRGSWLWQAESRLLDVIQHHNAYHCLNAMDVPQLDLALTASNKSPISSVSLERGLQGEFTSAKLIALIATYCDRMAAIDPNSCWMTPWLAPWLAQTKQLFDGVLQSQR